MKSLVSVMYESNKKMRKDGFTKDDDSIRIFNVKISLVLLFCIELL